MIPARASWVACAHPGPVMAAPTQQTACPPPVPAEPCP